MSSVCPCQGTCVIRPNELFLGRPGIHRSLWLAHFRTCDRVDSQGLYMRLSLRALRAPVVNLQLLTLNTRLGMCP